MSLLKFIKARASGQVLAQQSIGVLVGAALPGVVRRGKVNLGAQPSLQLFVGMELGAVVCGDCSYRVELPAKDFRRPLQRFLGSGRRKLTYSGKSAFTLHHSHHARLSRPVDCVDLPVSKPDTLLNLGRTLPNHLLARQSPPTVIPRIPLTLLFTRPAQVPPQRSTSLLVRPDPALNRLVAHRTQSFQPQPAHDLLRTIVLTQHCLHRRKMLRTVVKITPRPASTTSRVLASKLWPIVAVVVRFVPRNLPINCAAMPLQLPRYITNRTPRGLHRTNSVSILFR